jgi:hypothetical protein
VICHDWVHHHVAEALAAGWLVPADGDPSAVPVEHWMWQATGPVLLDTAGGFDISTWQ